MSLVKSHVKIDQALCKLTCEDEQSMWKITRDEKGILKNRMEIKEGCVRSHGKRNSRGQQAAKYVKRDTSSVYISHICWDYSHVTVLYIIG